MSRLRVCSSVQGRGGNNVVTLGGKINNRAKDCIGSAGQRNTCKGMPALELRVARLENVGGWVHHTTVDIA